ncbi:hypothetical protein [Vreelandella piezotolerans]|uniref:hypothetical protein n=1 Tax=Vreelandella piezotolerans TaxID=2609667 RepID=UPI00378EC59B
MSVRSLGSLTLDMVLKTGNFLGPMDKAQRETQRKMRQMERDAKKAGAGIAAVAGAATAAAAGIYAYAKSSMDTIDANAKLARSLGGTIDGLRAVNMEASDSGIDGMEASLNRMNRRLGAVEMNGGPALKTVERLNLNLQEMQGMDVDEKLAYIADRIKESGVSSQEAARHLQQLGFEQRNATELFMKGGDAIRSSRQEIEDYGLSVSMLDAAKIEEANDALARIGLSAEAMGNAVAIKLAPALNDMADSINDVTKAFHAGDYDAQIDIIKGLAAGVAGAAGAYAAYRLAVNAATIAQWAFNAAIRVNPLGALVTVAGTAVGAIYAFREELGLVNGAANRAENAIDNATRAINGGSLAAVNNSYDALSVSLGEVQETAQEATLAVLELERAKALYDDSHAGLASGAEAEIARQHAIQAEAWERMVKIQNKQNELAEKRAEIEKQISELGSDRTDTDTDTDAGGSSTKNHADAIKQQVAALQLQAETLGMAEDELVLYKLAQDGATDSQLAAARAALDAVSAYEASEQAASDYQNLLLELRTTEQRLTDQLHERLAVLDAVNVASDEYAETAARIAEAAFVDAPEYGGLDATIGGPFGELDKIDEAEEKLQEWYATQLEMLEQFRSERADLTEQWDAQERALQEEHQNELMRIERARHIAQMAAAESTFGDLAGLARGFAGEQSGIYRALFATEKAFAIGKALMAVPSSFSKAYEAVVGIPVVGPVLAPVAGAAAAAAQVAQASSIQSIGMAHDGIDSIPETGTWLLEKGERVTTAETSAKLDATLARVESQMNRPGDGGGSGLNVNINNSTNAKVSARRDEGGGLTIDIVKASLIDDMATDGKVTKAGQHYLGWGRQPR